MRLTTLAVVFISMISWGRASEPAKPPQKFLPLIEGRFAAWDNDQDGVLTNAEIDAAVADANVRGAEAAAIAALKRSARSSRYKLPQLTLREIEHLIVAGPGKD